MLPRLVDRFRRPNIRRVLWGVLSQGYSQLVTVGMQLISVPVLMANWGLDTYGAWILLTTLPTYLGLVDLGFAQIAANDMTMRVAREDFDGAQDTFQTACALIGTIVAVALLGFGAFAFLFPVSTIFHLNAISPSDASFTLIALSFQVAFTIVHGLFGAGLRAIGHFPLMVGLNSTARLFEGVAVLVASYWHFSFFVTALSVASIRLMITLGAAITLFRKAKWLRFGVDRTNIKRFYSMLGPSLTYMSYSISYALNLQGAILLIGAALNPEAVAVFSATRTLTRMGTTASNVF